MKLKHYSTTITLYWSTMCLWYDQLGSIADRTIAEADQDGDGLIAFDEFVKVSIIFSLKYIYIYFQLEIYIYILNWNKIIYFQNYFCHSYPYERALTR